MCIYKYRYKSKGICIHIYTYIYVYSSRTYSTHFDCVAFCVMETGPSCSVTSDFVRSHTVAFGGFSNNVAARRRVRAGRVAVRFAQYQSCTIKEFWIPLNISRDSLIQMRPRPVLGTAGAPSASSVPLGLDFLIPWAPSLHPYNVLLDEDSDVYVEPNTFAYNAAEPNGVGENL